MPPHRPHMNATRTDEPHPSRPARQPKVTPEAQQTRTRQRHGTALLLDGGVAARLLAPSPSPRLATEAPGEDIGEVLGVLRVARVIHGEHLRHQGPGFSRKSFEIYGRKGERGKGAGGRGGQKKSIRTDICIDPIFQPLDSCQWEGMGARGVSLPEQDARALLRGCQPAAAAERCPQTDTPKSYSIKSVPLKGRRYAVTDTRLTRPGWSRNNGPASSGTIPRETPSLERITPSLRPPFPPPPSSRLLPMYIPWLVTWCS